jgi:hypothetical protein
MISELYEASVGGKREIKVTQTREKKADGRDGNVVKVVCRRVINAGERLKGQSLKETCPERESSSWPDWRSGELGTAARFSL